jgi:tripeptide aminopeptidase
MSLVTDLFMRFVAYDTSSDYESATYPSTESQRAFANVVAAACAEAGLSEVLTDEYCCVTATLPANTGSSQPVIGLVAHMDTSSDAPGCAKDARIVRGYDGGDIALGHGLTLSPAEFPELTRYKGQDIIVSDGNALLGADDKAGIAEILAAMAYLKDHPEIKHGKIRVAFTPDEEVGRGVDHFDVAKFGADFAYTIDGGEIGELDAETFNAARAVFTVTGKSFHPGTAYGVMVNAGLIAAELIGAFPPDETPATTRGRNGFYHLTDMKAETASARLSLILRDFDAEGLEKRKAYARDVADRLNKKYGAETVRVELKDEYRNMYEVLASKPEILDRARAAIRGEGIEVVEHPVRGGTDGARLSFMGLPCPNLFTGGHNFHGPYEYIPAQSMEAAVRVIVNLAQAVEN